MAAVGPVSIDMYLPGFPAIEREFGVRGVETTMAAYLVGLAVSQLFYGPISDRFGRKPPLYFGFVLYALGAAGCALADDHARAHADARRAGARRLRGIRDRTRDRARPLRAARSRTRFLVADDDRGARTRARAGLGGGFIVTHFGWRATFVFQVSARRGAARGDALRAARVAPRVSRESLNLASVLRSLRPSRQGSSARRLFVGRRLRHGRVVQLT